MQVRRSCSILWLLLVSSTGWLCRQRPLAAAHARPGQGDPTRGIIVDRTQQAQLEQAIREAIAHVPMQVVLIEQLDSWAVPGLQAVDFVAWSFEQKYGLGKDWAAQIIAEKVTVEEKVRGTKIAALPGGR